MKIVLACEGKTEVCLIKDLIERGILSFNSEIIYEEPLVLRQLDKIKPLIVTLPLDEDILVFRIGDTLTDEMSLKGLEIRMEHIRIYKICTKPEIEILVIIQEGFWTEYNNSEFCGDPKQFLKSKKFSFDPNTYFLQNGMIDSIVKYKKYKKHKKEEYYLADLIDWCNKGIY